MNGRGSDLALAISSGAGPVLRLLMQRTPVFWLGRVREAHNPLAKFFCRTGLDPSDRCHAIVSLNGGVVIFGHVAGRPAVVHLPTSKSSYDQIMRYQHGLAFARSELADTDLARLLPELLTVSETHLVQSRTEGRFLDPILLSGNQLTAAIIAGLNIAVSLHRVGQEREEACRTSLVPAALNDMLGTVGQQGKEFIATACAAVERWAPSMRLWSVPMHGDLWLGNLCFKEDLSCVTGVIDWEWYDGHGLPLLDAIHLIMTSVAMHRRVPVSALLPQIWLGDDEYLCMLFDHACALFKVDRTLFQWMGIVEWLGLIARGSIEPRPSRFDTWLSDIVLAPGAAVCEWLASQRT